jgi:hypothetical protein
MDHLIPTLVGNAQRFVLAADESTDTSINPLGEDLLPWIVLAIGGALAVGTALALVRPREDAEGNDLARPPMVRSIAMIVLGGVAALWGLASLLS